MPLPIQFQCEECAEWTTIKTVYITKADCGHCGHTNVATLKLPPLRYLPKAFPGKIFKRLKDDNGPQGL